MTALQEVAEERDRTALNAICPCYTMFPLSFPVAELSRDSLAGQQMALSLCVEGSDGGVDGAIERVGIGEGLVSEVVGLEVAPDALDVVEFGSVFGQPFDREPMGAGSQRGDGRLADVDWPVVEHDHDRLGRPAWSRAVERIELVQERDEVGGALGRAGVHDEPAADLVEGSHHGDFLGLTGRGHPQVGATLGPGSGQIGMGQRLALVGEQQHDVAGLGLRLAQQEPQADAIDRLGVLPVLQVVPRSAPAEVFLRSTLTVASGRCLRLPAARSRRQAAPASSWGGRRRAPGAAAPPPAARLPP